MALATMTPEQLEGAEKTLRRGTWTITAGAVLFSVLTVTPLVQRVTPDEWDWTAPILPAVVDVAVIIVVRLDSTVSRLGGSTGGWPTVLRWMTGLFTLLLNVGDSALKRDAVGVAVHSVAPLLLIVTAEAGLAYRRKIAAALENIERSRAAEQERSRAAQQAAREREQQRREQAEQAAREHAEQLERERLEREAAERREEREHAALLEQQRAEREAQQRREERDEREQARIAEQQRLARERREQQQQEQQETARREQQRAELAARREQSAARSVNTALETVNAHGPEKLAESDARRMVALGLETSASVRELAEATGWSVGWVANRIKELREQPAMATAGAS